MGMELVDRFLKINDVNAFVHEIYLASSMLRSFILFKRQKRTTNFREKDLNSEAGPKGEIQGCIS